MKRTKQLLVFLITLLMVWTAVPMQQWYVSAAVTGTITDSWDQIIANINNGTYKSKYKIGDTKELDLGSEGVVEMQIAAFDADELADGSGTAAITWISKQPLASNHRMNPYREFNSSTGSYVIGTGSIGGWEHSEMRSWLNNNIKPLIPSVVRNSIKPVKKYSSSFDMLLNQEHNAETVDDVWIPSYREVFGSGSYHESNGPIYSDLFVSRSDRIKQKNDASTGSSWWLRSAQSEEASYYGGNFQYVDFTGNLNIPIDADGSAVVLGFCMGGKNTTDAVTSISLDKSSATLIIGNSVTLSATVMPDNATNKTVIWSCGDSSIATVNNGKVTGVKAGSTTITAKAGNKTATCKVTVTDSVSNKTVFKDIRSSDYFYNAVLWAVEKAITKGTTDTTFSPNDGCTRGQCVTFLYRYAGSPTVDIGKALKFKDVKNTDYYASAVAWAVENDITAGTSETTFSPGDKCTRGQIVTFLWRYNNKPTAGQSNTFTDVKSGKYYVDAVSWAVNQDVTKGTSETTFSPDATCTRAQIVTFLYRMDVNTSNEVFDINDPNLILKPVWFTDENNREPDSQLVANVLDIYFYEEVKKEDRISFLEEVLGGEVVGRINVLDMMEVRLPNTLKEAQSIGYHGTINLNTITEDELLAYADAIVNTYSNIVESIDLEYIHSPEEFERSTNDTWNGDLTKNWWLNTIQAYDAWDYENSCKRDFLTDITIGVVDSGFQDDHPDLLGNVRIISKEDSPRAHGTHVAGIIGATADNNIGIAGVMHNNASIVAYDACTPDGFSDAEIKNGLTSTVEAGAKVVNFSLGCSGNLSRGQYNYSEKHINSEGEIWSKQIGKLLAKGYDFIVVQAAGNGNDDGEGVSYQNNLDFCAINRNNCWSSKKISVDDIINRILIVSAVSQSNQMRCSSNGGTNGDLSIVAAPGSGIYSTVSYEWDSDNNTVIYNDSDYDELSGTSMAAPIVTAVCGLTWSVNTELSGSEVKDIVIRNTRNQASDHTGRYTITDSSGNPYTIRSHTTGGMGIVNALASVEAAIATRERMYGFIVDSDTGLPISAKTIVYNNDERVGSIVGEQDTNSELEIYQFFTNALGKVTLPQLPSGQYALKITADGYTETSILINIRSDSGEIIESRTDGAIRAKGNGNTEYLGTIQLVPSSRENNKDELGSANIGDYVTFGHYEQDNNTANGKEAIKWKVLDKKDGRVLLLSKYGLDAKKYDDTYTYSGVTWETCTLRSWLNSDFLNEAFSPSEQSTIPTVTLSNPDNPIYGTEGGNDTNDKVFLLNLQEMQQYFNLSETWTDYDGSRHEVLRVDGFINVGGSKDAITSQTAYAVAQGASVYSYYHDEEGKESCWWWLRSPGYSGGYDAAFVNYVGEVYAGHAVSQYNYFAVRPAIWVNIAS